MSVSVEEVSDDVQMDGPPPIVILLLMMLAICSITSAGYFAGHSDVGAAREEGRAAGFAELEAKWTAETQAKAEAEAKLFTVPPRVITRNGPKTGDGDLEWQPPRKMQGALLTAAYFTSDAEVGRMCGNVASGGPAGACESQDGNRKPVLVLPNPCDYYDAYALLICHELGHAHGWPSDHRGGHFTPPGSTRWLPKETGLPVEASGTPSVATSAGTFCRSSDDGASWVCEGEASK